MAPKTHRPVLCFNVTNIVPAGYRTAGGLSNVELLFRLVMIPLVVVTQCKSNGLIRRISRFLSNQIRPLERKIDFFKIGLRPRVARVNEV